MKRLITVACLGFAFVVSTSAFAGAQQEKMKGCSAEAKGMKGAERRAFMSKCLKKDYVLKSAATPAAGGKAAPPEAVPARQQGRMNECSAEANARKLKGPERRTFMSSCLKG